MVQSRAWLAIELAVLAAATFAVYALLWVTQNALWTNGLNAQTPPFLPRPGTDPDLGLSDSIRVMVLGTLVVGLAAWLFARANRFAAAGLTWAVFAIPAVVGVVLYVLPPTLSIDAYSYLSHGFLAATPGQNPYLDPSSGVINTAHGIELLRNGWQPVHGVTPYGPLWTAIERLAFVLSGGDVPRGILLINAPTFAAVIGTALLIWKLLGEIAPERRVTGVVLFAANPLVLIELVGDGHNDAVMIFFVVLGLYATVRRWAFVAVLAIAAGALVKASALPLGLLVVVALVVWRRSWLRTIGELVAGILAAAAATALLFAPYWVGMSTLDGLFAEGMPAPGWSVSGIVASIFLPHTAQTVITVALVVITVACCFLVRTVRGFLRAASIVGLVILLLLPLEWPWYAALPSALLAVSADEELDAVVIVVLAWCSRLIAPLGDAVALSAMDWSLFATAQALIGQLVAAFFGLCATVSEVFSTRLWRGGARRGDGDGFARRQLTPEWDAGSRIN